MLRLSLENSFTVFSSFQANESENVKRGWSLEGGERKYWALVEGKVKSITHSSQRQ